MGLAQAAMEHMLAEEVKRSFPQASVEYSRKLIKVKVSPEDLVKVATFLKGLGFDLFTSVGGVDYPKDDRIEVLYTVWSTSKKLTAILRADVSRGSPFLDTLVRIWPAADWHERETHELLGVVFKGNPNLGPPGSFLLPSPWVWGYPLRKEFKLLWSETWLPEGYSRRPYKGPPKQVPQPRPAPQPRREPAGGLKR